jgi:NNP family nitrate/nitrite transporter-like MFS transporter
MVATPVLAGAALRIVLGVLVDHLGPKRTGLLAQSIVLTGLLVAWLAGIQGFHQVLALAVLLGFAGASFAVALPLASRWYPPEHQGMALGIAGAGNSGTVLAALFAPALAVAVGWRDVFGLAAIPLAVVLVVYALLAKDSPNQPRPKTATQYFAILKEGDAWWFMFFYSVTFGGFVGLSSSLTIYFNDQYGLDPVHAGYATALCVFTGSLLRPVGGAIADRIGGVRALSCLYVVAAAMLAVVSFGLPHLWMATGVFMLGMGALGMGNGAVFQLVPQRFQDQIGVMTGLVGMTGGVGGFYLASSLGLSKQLSGTYQAGLLAFAALAIIAVTGLTGIKRRWRATWSTATARI